jgi:hypothetical protein
MIEFLVVGAYGALIMVDLIQAVLIICRAGIYDVLLEEPLGAEQSVELSADELFHNWIMSVALMCLPAARMIFCEGWKLFCPDVNYHHRLNPLYRAYVLCETSLPSPYFEWVPSFAANPRKRCLPDDIFHHARVPSKLWADGHQDVRFRDIAEGEKMRHHFLERYSIANVSYQGY